MCRQDEYPMPHDGAGARRKSKRRARKDTGRKSRLDLRRLQLKAAPAVVWAWPRREKRDRHSVLRDARITREEGHECLGATLAFVGKMNGVAPGLFGMTNDDDLGGLRLRQLNAKDED